MFAVSVSRRIEVVFRFFFALPFSQCCCEEVVEAGLLPGVRRGNIVVVSHLFRFVTYFRDTDGTVTISPKMITVMRGADLKFSRINLNL